MNRLTGLFEEMGVGIIDKDAPGNFVDIKDCRQNATLKR